MSRRTKLVVAVVLIVVASTCGGWAWFLSGQTLDDADKWSSVMAGFTGLVLGAGGLLAGALALRQPVGTEREPSPSQTRACTAGVSGDSHAPIVSGDNNNSVHVQNLADVYRVDLRGAKGVQIGDDNTQINHW